MTKQVSWVLVWIVFIDYVCKNDQYSCLWCKILINKQNMINENKWKISTNRKMWKYWFWWMLKIFFGENPLRKISTKRRMWKNQFWFMFKKKIGWDPLLLKEYTVLSPNTEGAFFLVNNSIATKVRTNFLYILQKQLKIVHDKIQCLNFVVHYLNMKIK